MLFRMMYEYVYAARSTWTNSSFYYLVTQPFPALVAVGVVAVVHVVDVGVKDITADLSHCTCSTNSNRACVLLVVVVVVVHGAGVASVLLCGCCFYRVVYSYCCCRCCCFRYYTSMRHSRRETNQLYPNVLPSVGCMHILCILSYARIRGSMHIT